MIARAGHDPNYTRRYPGAPPFADLPLHRKLFFGRPADARNLVDTILAESLVVVYARSGSGKTSLINVAVKDRLRSEGYAPLVVRIGKQDQNPLEAVFQGIAQSAQDQGFEHHVKTTASLWHYFKTAEFWQGDTLLKPVLVVDQFEELFTLHTQEKRLAFSRQVAHLLRGPAPELASPLPEAVGELSETPPPVKVVFSMREDFLAMLDELVPDLPNILTTRFRLAAMDREQATRAIEGPAGVEDAALEAPTFTYTEGTVGKMVDFLAEGVATDLIGTDGINPFQIQIVCQHVEDLVLARTRGVPAEKRTAIAISYEDLGGATGLKETVSRFYERQLNNFNPYLRRRIQRLCEEGLANREGRRIPQEQSEIVNRFSVDPKTLGRLVDLRLLQRERRLGGNHYELSHDTLLHPVLNARKRRAARRRIIRFSAAVAVLTIALVATVSALRRSSLQNELDTYVQASLLSESDSENRLIQAVAAVATSNRMTSLNPAALRALAGAELEPTVFKTPLPKDVTRAALSPDGQILALAKAGALELRYPLNDTFSRSLQPAFGAPISILAFAPRGDRIAAVAGRDVRVWDIAGRELGAVTTADVVTAVAFDPLMEGPGLAIATTAGGWSMVAGREKTWVINPRRGEAHPVLERLHFSPDGKWIIGASARAVAHAWTRHGTFVRSDSVDAGLRKWTTSFDAAGNLRWLAAIAGSRVTVIDAQHGFAQHPSFALVEAGATPGAGAVADAGVDHRPVEIAFSPDGKYLAVGTMSGDTQVFEFDDKAGRFAFRERFGGRSLRPIRGFSWSGDHRLLSMQEGGSTLRTIGAAAAATSTSPTANPTAAARNLELARELRGAAVGRQLFALDGGGVILTDYMEDWIKVIRPSEAPIRVGVYNPRVLPLEKDWLFATETNTGLVLRLWEPWRNTKVEWQTSLKAAEVLRAASRNASEIFAVTAARQVARDPSPYEVLAPSPSRVTETTGVRLYRGAKAGGGLTEVPLSGNTSGEITHVVAQSAGNFVLMAADGAVFSLSPTGSIRELARVGGIPNVAFNRHGRLMTWLHGGQPRQWDLRDPDDPDPRPTTSPVQDTPVKNSTKVIALQAIAAVDDGAFVIADDAGDLHIVDEDDIDGLKDRTSIKARVGDVQQLAVASTAAFALIASDSAGDLSVVHLRGRPRSTATFDGTAISVGDNGRLVATLDPDRDEPEIRLSGADLERRGILTTFEERCFPSAIAASPTSDVLIIGCREGLMAAVTSTGAALPHPVPAFDPREGECSFGGRPDRDPPLESTVVALAFAPSGRFFAGAARHKIAVWDADGSLRVKAQAPPALSKDDFITSLAVGPSDVIAVGTHKGAVILINVSGQELTQRGDALHTTSAAVTAIAFSPDGRQIVAGYEDRVIQRYVRRWWWTTTYTKTPTVLTTLAPVVSLAFAPDGQRFASGGGNGEVRLWSSTADDAIAPVTTRSGVPTAVAFTPDGLRLILSSDTSIETTTTVPTTSWLAEACGRLAWSHRVRTAPADDQAVVVVRDACQPVWTERRSTTSLIDVAATGQIDLVETLLSTADPNTADGFGRTPLMRAVAKGHAAVARLLVANRADVLRRDAIGATALHHAAAADARSVLPVLIEAGLSIDQQDQNGGTPLMYAAARGHREFVQMLIDRKADVNLADTFGRTTLMKAAERDDVEMFSALRRAGANVNAREQIRLSFGKTAGQLAGRQIEALLLRSVDSTDVTFFVTPAILFRLPISTLATNDAQRQRAERLIAWRRGGMSAADAGALMRDLQAAVTGAGQKPDPADLVLLGFARGFGVDGKPDWGAAMQQFMRAAELKSRLADTLISLLLLEGLGERQQFSLAVDRLTNAAAHADAEPLGAWLLAVLHRDGFIAAGSMTEREKNARDFMAKATEGMGARFGPGWNSKAFLDVNDPRRIESELEASCAQKIRSALTNAFNAEDVVAASNLADSTWYAREPNAIARLLSVRALASRSLPIAGRTIRLEYLATYRVGVSYAHGVGTPRDYTQALRWLKESAEGGNAEADRELGRMYELGLGVQPSLPSAVTHYHRAAAGGDAYSRNRLLALGYVH